MNSAAPLFIELPFRHFKTNAPVLGRIGNLETRLARSPREVLAAQSLRYEIFYCEMNAKPDAKTLLTKRDEDRFDRYCDHLLVLDKSLPKDNQVVGTYRLMDNAASHTAGGFYSQDQFDLAPLLGASLGNRFLELGRSCIARPYRSKRTIELMWQGIWAIVLSRKVDVLFGCASFSGTSLKKHSQALAWLSSNAILNGDIDCQAKRKDSIALSRIDSKQIPTFKTFAALPPLLKGYLRAGAKIGSHAVVDHQFGTIDVLVVLAVAQISEKYVAHYGADASRFAA